MKHVSKMERQEKKKKLDKKNERTSKAYLEEAFGKELDKLTKKNKRIQKSSDKMEDDDEEIPSGRFEDRMQVENVNTNENNLLLKFDAEVSPFILLL